MYSKLLSFVNLGFCVTRAFPNIEEDIPSRHIELGLGNEVVNLSFSFLSIQYTVRVSKAQMHKTGSVSPPPLDQIVGYLINENLKAGLEARKIEAHASLQELSRPCVIHKKPLGKPACPERKNCYRSDRGKGLFTHSHFVPSSPQLHIHPMSDMPVRLRASNRWNFSPIPPLM